MGQYSHTKKLKVFQFGPYGFVDTAGNKNNFYCLGNMFWDDDGDLVADISDEEMYVIETDIEPTERDEVGYLTEFDFWSFVWPSLSQCRKDTTLESVMGRGWGRW